MKKEQILEEIMKVLNEALEADQDAIEGLMNFHEPCNVKIADHDSIVVSVAQERETTIYNLGVIGLINGICKRLTGENIAAMYLETENGEMGRLAGFVKYEKPN